ncbi:unnamed protein product [Cylicostephanus goldi]|uniref:Uncharacterized protein n=1 Tax=Cylicostephanus goldi TaxID=71465 RepID=A0A3P7LTH0_CYLGO|nr:unnamed protein product [Cylicostephanus goldi]
MSVKESTDQLVDPELRAHLFDIDLLAHCYAAGNWADTVATSKALRTIHRALERSLLKMSRQNNTSSDFAVRI